MDSRLNKPIAAGIIILALVLGVVLGLSSGIAGRIFGGPSPKTIASAATVRATEFQSWSPS